MPIEANILQYFFYLYCLFRYVCRIKAAERTAAGLGGHFPDGADGSDGAEACRMLCFACFADDKVGVRKEWRFDVVSEQGTVWRNK